MSIILTFFLYIFTQCYTFQKRLKVSLSYMFTMISYCVEISIIRTYGFGIFSAYSPCARYAYFPAFCLAFRKKGFRMSVFPFNT